MVRSTTQQILLVFILMLALSVNTTTPSYDPKMETNNYVVESTLCSASYSEPYSSALESPDNDSKIYEHDDDKFDGSEIERFEYFNYTQQKVIVWGVEPESRISLSFLFSTIYAYSSSDFIEELETASAAIILSDASINMNPNELKKVARVIISWVERGNILVVNDIGLMTVLGIQLSIPDVVKIDSERGALAIEVLNGSLVAGEIGTKLMYTQNPAYGFNVSGGFLNTIAMYQSSLSRLAAAMLYPRGYGFCLIIGFDIEELVTNDDRQVGSRLLSKILEKLSFIQVSLYTHSIHIDDAVSPNIHILNNNSDFLSRLDAAADALCASGMNVMFSNTLYADQKGGYYGRLSLQGGLSSVTSTFSARLSINRTLARFLDAPQVPIKVEDIFRDIRPMMGGEYFWPAGWEPPQVSYYHLAPIEQAADDMGSDNWFTRSIELALDATPAQRFGLSGQGVKVVVIDSGFSRNTIDKTKYPTTTGYHPYYEEYYTSLLLNRYHPHSVGILHPDDDIMGHGTGMIANLLAVSPGIDLHVIPKSNDPVDSFEVALQQNPDIITCSWHHEYNTVLQDQIREAAANGIIVLFAGGNQGIFSYQTVEPCVVSVGGAYVDAYGNMEASDYSNSGEYEGRLYPDFCGIVGMDEISDPQVWPDAILIEMPTEAGSYDEEVLSPFDGTDPDDGWFVCSGTSAAAPQVAGLAALVKEFEPGINVGRFKHLVMTSCTDIITGESVCADIAKKGFDRATGAGLINVSRTLETLIDYSSSDIYREKTISSGKHVNFMEINTPYGPGYHIDTSGATERGFYFFGYLASRDGPIMMSRGGMSVSGYFRQYDTLPQDQWPGRRYLSLYILSVDGNQILKTVRLLDYDDGTTWKFVYVELNDIAPSDNWGLVRIAIGRVDSWDSDWHLTAEWAKDVNVYSSHEPWTPDTIPDGKYFNFGPSTAPEAHMGHTYHLDTTGSSQYGYLFFADSWSVPFLGPYYDIHIAGWFRQDDIFPDYLQEGRRYVDFYLIDPSSWSVIASKRILDYYDGTDWVYSRIHFKCGWISGSYLLAIGRSDAWMMDWHLTVEWCNVQIWTYG